MALLQSLGLTPTPAMRQRAATAARDVTIDGAPQPGASRPAELIKGKPEPAARPAAFAGADAADEARRAAVAVRPQLLARQKQALEVQAKIVAGARALEQQIAKAPASAQATLLAKQKQFDKARDEVAARLAQLHADLAAIESPTTRREELVKLLARAKAGGRADDLIEVETARGATDQKFNERKQVTTETSYGDGEAKVVKSEDTVRVGLDGITKTSAGETERQDADGSSKVSREQTVKLGPGGVAVDRKDAVAFESDGKTWGSETSSSFEAGAGGVKSSKGVKTTRADGSSLEAQRDQAVERGDGKLGVSEGGSYTRTDADGNAVSGSKNAKTGLLAGDDGLGGYADAEAGLTRTDKDGVNTGIVGGLHANVLCKIGDPAGEPPLYPLTLTVKLGAEIKITGGRAKQGAAAGYGAEIKFGAEVVMPVTRQLTAAQLQTYLAALEGASKGSKVDATYAEMAIIQAGVAQGWEVAQAMFLKRDPFSAEMLAQLRNAGDSNAVIKKTGGGAKLKGNVKAVNLELGAEREQETSKKATRDADGKLTIESGRSDTENYAAKAGVSMGVVGGSVGGTSTQREGFGYEITVDPQRDPGGKIAAALLACNSAPDFEAFIAKYGAGPFKGSIQVRSKTVSKADAESSSVGLSIGPADLALGTHSGVAEQTKVDGDGKLVERVVVGTAGAGGSVGSGDTRWGDSSDVQATARRDGAGNASLDLARDQSQTTFDKVLDVARGKAAAVGRALGLGDDEDTKKPAKGALTSAAGGGEEKADTQRHDRYGLGLTDKDLDEVAKLASNDRDWTPRVGNADDIKAWRAAGARIRAAQGDRGVVAEELARFVGGAKSDRMQQLRLFLRQGGAVKVGTAYNFPDGLKSVRKDWDELVLGACDQQVLRALDAQGPAKAAELGRALQGRLRQLLLTVRNSDAFGDPAAQADMVGAIVERTAALDAALRRAEGKQGPADDLAAAQAQFDQLCGACGIARRNFDLQFSALDTKIRGDSYLTQGEKNKLLAPVEKLLELRGILRRQIAAAKALADAHGFPARRWEQFQADDKGVDRIKNAVGMYHSE
jgi:hypothetical protein